MFLAVMMCVCGQVTSEDYFSLSYLSSCSISPDGAYVAWAEGRWDEELDRRNYDVWVAQLNETNSQPLRLTFDESNDGSTQWGSTNEWLYFSSRRGSSGDDLPRNGKKQIWRIKPNGTQLMAVTRLAGGVEDWQINSDGSGVYYVISDENHIDDGWKELRKEHSDIEYGHGIVDYSEIWFLDLQTWKHVRVWDEDKVIVDFSPSPNGGKIATVTTPDTRLITNEGWSDIGIYDVETQTTTLLDDTLWRKNAPSPYGWVESPEWTWDGRRLVFTVDFDGFPRNMFVATFGKSVTIQEVERKDEVSLGSAPMWIPETYDLLYIAEQGTMRPLFQVSHVGNGIQGKTREVISNNVICWDFSIAQKTKQIASIIGNEQSLPRLVTVGDTPNTVSVVANPNAFVDDWEIPIVQTVRWVAQDGTTIEGVLELPHQFEVGVDAPLPMYVDIHGGPTSSDSAGLEFSTYGRGLLSTDGWAVFCPNYRGSTGYGDKFLTDLVGHENNIEVQDILDGVDAMVERGIADANKLAVGGWSNGGYLTNCLIAATNRFKAASSGAGVFDQTMQWSIEDTPGHVVNYARGLPWEVPEELQRMSPIFKADNITTPTIIHVGAGDARVPAEHSKALFRALHDYLEVPTQLVIYPGAGHGLSKMSHRRAKMEWDRAWLRHWVLEEN